MLKIFLNIIIWFKIASLIRLDLVDRTYYESEFGNVKKMCQNNSDCSSKLKSVDQNSKDSLFAILEPYYESYWKGLNCQWENEPCGIDWNYCCSTLACFFMDERDQVGLCSYSNSTYIISKS
jgi:hypothetical protein